MPDPNTTGSNAATLNVDQRPDANHPPRRATPLFGRWTLIALVLLSVLLIAGLIAVRRSKDVMSSVPSIAQTSSTQKALVDETPWTTAQALAALAITQEEMTFARQAEHLADHDVDQAFAAALRRATLRQTALSGDALAAQQHVTELEATVAADQVAVKSLTAAGGDDFEVAQAQLDLDQDELIDARADAARASGDQREEIQQQLTAREADMKKFDAAQGTGEVAVISVKRYRTLAGLIGGWQRQNQRYQLLVKAQAAAQQQAAKLSGEHDALEATAKPNSARNSNDVAAKQVAGLKRSSLQRQLMSIDDDRVATQKQLAAIYAKWAAQVELQHKIVAHLILVQMMWVAVILILSILIDALVRRVTERESLDHRRMRTLSRISRLVIQVIALVSVLLVMFGPPDHISTVIGLTTAGLTVALQDFILAFVGWFLLMGKSGVGVGDIVEIDGVCGEVVEIGLFRTTLLETGNWTATGHPTGRRVAFNNKYAISGKFFNFSTAGQWMWDELTVTVPEDENTYAVIERVHTTVASATKDDSAQAEKEWRQSSSLHGLEQFSAEPAVNVRPAASGVDLIVRYVTRASGRVEQRNRLYQCVLDATHAPQIPDAKQQAAGTQVETKPAT